MHATERAVPGASQAGASSASAAELEVVLKPLSRPDLGEIRVDGVLAVGRAEQPFASYQDDIVVMLSRRHARVFCEAGVAYVVDLESRNGTTVNRAGIGQQQPCPLRDGDEVCFGGVLAYRVEIASRAAKARPDDVFTLTLTPASAASGLQTIVITRFPFLVSKTDAAFARERGGHAAQLSYLSRRHAHVFLKGGGAWIEDLGSTNGTFVDGLRLQESAVPLQDGALLAFGGDHFTYRVGLSQADEGEPLAPPRAAGRAAGGASAGAPGVPGAATPAAPSAASRAARADVPAVPGPSAPATPPGAAAKPSAGSAAAPTARAAKDAAASPADASAPEARPVAQSAGKTTFVAAPTSFLEIFCAEEAPDEAGADGARATEPAAGDAVGPATAKGAPKRGAKGDAAGRRAGKARPGRIAALWGELAAVLQGDSDDQPKRGARRAVALGAVLLVLAVGLTWWAGSERKLKDLVARGDYAEAAELAQRQLAQRPDDPALRALATEATLKTQVPVWLAKVAARDFDAASGVVAELAKRGERNPDLQPLVAELEWLGQLQRLVAARGGPDKPIRIYADEAQIGALIDRWNADTREHQRALARIASYVPQFGEPHAEALTHLRRLQSEATVHFAAIERVKSAVVAELRRDRPEALVPVLKETAEKYPGLGGIDTLRQDVDRFVELRAEARARKPGRLFALVRQARFATPPFQEAFQALAASGALPPAELVRQYEDVTKTWQAGESERAQAALQQMAAGPWAPALRSELERRQGVLAQFAALQQSRGSPAHAEQLLAFRTALDADEDVHFARATQADLDRQKDKVLARAQEALGRAGALWQEYRAGGAIDAGQRSETAVSNGFRTRARLLADAQRSARQGLQMVAQLGAGRPDGAAATAEEIRTEAQAQRSALLELRNVLEPEVLKAKLALLGDTSDEPR